VILGLVAQEIQKVLIYIVCQHMIIIILTIRKIHRCYIHTLMVKSINNALSIVDHIICYLSVVFYNFVQIALKLSLLSDNK
jgi:hypothetical protein